MANPRNETSVGELRKLLTEAKTFFLVDYQGLSAGDLGELRASVRAAGGKILVAKNTLINVVLKEQGVEEFGETLQGPTALVLVGEDFVAPVKAITEFAKAHPKELPRSKGGRLEGSILGEDALARVAKLPSKQDVQSQLVGVLIAPVQQLIGVLEGPQRNLVTVMNNYVEKLRDEEGGA